MTTTQDVADHYDSLDELYRQLWGEHLHHGYWSNPRFSTSQAVEALIARVTEGLGLAQGDRICDVGCGYGASLRHLARTKGITGVGLTVSKKQVEYAEKQDRPTGVSYLCQDFLNNDLPSESFDAMYAIESSEHMPSFDGFLAQIKRLLKPGKRMAIAVWLRDPGTNRLFDTVLNDKIVSEGRLVQMYPSDEFIRRVAKEFRIVHFEDASKYVTRTWWICTRNLIHAIATDQKCRDFLFSPANKDRIFALTVPRILAGYLTGAMRYGILWAEKS